MRKKEMFGSKLLRGMFVAAGIAALAAASLALPLDSKILIDRALHSPTLTIRYNGFKAALANLILNGESIGTRVLNGSRTDGEINFSIDPNLLRDGENEVVVMLLDNTGKVIGRETTKISMDKSDRGAVTLEGPKMGSTVMGPVEIKVGFRADLKNAYVSFFVNDQFRSISNVPPFVYVWDTSKEANGWHTVQAWAIDDSSITHKSRTVRVFVNNPGGRTNRANVPVTGARGNPITADVEGTTAPVKNLRVNARPVTSPAKTGTAGEPRLDTLVHNPVRAKAEGATGLKQTQMDRPQVADVRNLTPTGTRTPASARPAPTPVVESVPARTQTVEPKAQTAASVPVLPKAVGTQVIDTEAAPQIVATQARASAAATATRAVTSATTLIPVTRGQRIPNLASYAVTWNAQFVNFDVNPRVENGVPMAPFRHLIEKGGGTVEWENLTKTVRADAEGRSILIQIGDANARVNNLIMTLEMTPYIDRGRTIVPLSFIREALDVNVEFDKATGHVLITTKNK